MNVILVDTSSWIEYLRGNAGASRDFVREHVGVDLATTEQVLMELLAGAAAGTQTQKTETLLRGQSWLHIDARLDYRGAVDVFHATRATGRQPRALGDCLIAAVALRNQVTVAHRDADFEDIAAATGLTTIDLRDPAR